MNNKSTMLLSTCFVLSIFYNGGPDQALLLTIIAALLLVTPARTLFNKQPLGKTAKSFLFGKLSLYCCIYCLSLVILYVNSTAKYFSIQTSWEFACFALVIWNYGLIQPKEAVWRYVYVMLMIIGIGCVLMELYELLQFYINEEQGRLYINGPRRDPNNLAAILFAIVTPGIFYYLGNKNLPKLSNKLLLPVNCCLFFGILLTDSRAIILIFTTVIILIVGWMTIRREVNTKSLVFLLAALTLTYGLHSTVKSNILPTSHLNFQSISNMESADWKIRKHLLNSSLTIYKNSNKFSGNGLGTYHIYYNASRDPGENATVGAHAHNDYLQMLTEGGLLWTMTFGLVFLWLAWAGLRHLKMFINNRSIEIQSENIVVFLVVVGLCAHALVNFVFYNLPTLMLFALMIARLNETPTVGREISLPAVINTRYLQTSYIVVILLALTPLALHGMLNTTLKSYTDAIDKIGHTTKISHSLASKIARTGIMIRPDNQQSRLLTTRFLTSQLSLEDDKVKQQAIHNEIENHLLKMNQQCLSCSAPYRRLADFYLKSSNQHQSLSLYNLAISKDPYNLYNYINKAKALNSGGDYENAMKLLLETAATKLDISTVVYGPQSSMILYREALNIATRQGSMNDQKMIAKKLLEVDPYNQIALQVLKP